MLRIWYHTPAVDFENTFNHMLAHLLRMSSSQWGGPVAMLNVPGKHKNLQPREDIKIFYYYYY